MKEKFKYEVDRSTPSNKLREFMDWSVDILNDIKYTRRVFANPISRFFVKFWSASDVIHTRVFVVIGWVTSCCYCCCGYRWHFNMGMIFLSFLFFILIMVTWKADNSPRADNPNETYYS